MLIFSSHRIVLNISCLRAHLNLLSRQGQNRSLCSKKGKTSSSKQWLRRHVNDPFVKKAQERGTISRAHYKLEFIDEKNKLIKKGSIVLDLGAAPGGWTAYAAEKGANIIAIDLLELDATIESLSNVTFIQGDFTKQSSALELLLPETGANLVMSDMAANFVGDSRTDAIRTADLCEQALEFSMDVLAPGGAFVGKYFSGPEEQELKEIARKEFAKVATVKPPASRKESAERFLVATGRL